MKKINFLLTFFAAGCLLLTSCSQEEQGSTEGPIDDSQTAVLEFGTILNDLANRAAASPNKDHFNAIPNCSDAAPAMAEITFSVDDGASQTVNVDILGNEAEGYFTDYDEALKIAIDAEGSVEVSLEGFIVYDANDNMIWIAPSDADDEGLFDGYVNEALPFNTTVYAGTKPYIDVEVLCYDRRMANEYGYVFFDLDTKEVFNFCLFGNFCTPGGRHYVANYSVDVWVGNDSSGTQIYDDLTSIAIDSNDDGVYEESPLCVALPDNPDVANEEYYFEITLLDSPEYDSESEGTIIRSGVLTEEEAKALFVGEDKLEYYHFFAGDCGETLDTPPVFNEPNGEMMTYKSCLHALPEGKSDVSGLKSNGYAYVTLLGNELTTQVYAFDMTPNKRHAQHIHGFANGDDATCPTLAQDADGDGFIQLGEGLGKYGGVQIALEDENGDFPLANAMGQYQYMRTFTLGTDGNPTVSQMSPLTSKAVVLHGFMYNGEYLGTLPVACGELEEN